jgi:hypothetical protein
MIVPHLTHHEEVCKWAKQNQTEIQDSVRWYFEQEDCRQSDDGEQTAKQHDPDVTFIHFIFPYSVIETIYFNAHSKMRVGASTLIMVRVSFVALSRMDLPFWVAGKINVPST